MDSYQKHLGETAARAEYIDEKLHHGFQRIVDDVPAGASVLDIACGSATLLAALAAKGCTVSGVDLSPGAVAMSRAKGYDVVQGNADEFDTDPTLVEMFGRKPDYLCFSKCLGYLARKSDIFRGFEGRGIYVYQSNQSYWRRLLDPDLNVLDFDGAAYRMADGRIIDINSLKALRHWGESFGYRSRVIPGLHWLRRNAVVVFER